MNAIPDPQVFAKPLLQLMQETFENTQGAYLDKGTSLLETLATLSAEQASIPVGGKCASLAAQVTHVIFFMESFERFAIYHDDSPVDWGHIWRTVEKVTHQEWEDLQGKLEATYQRMSGLFAENPLWTAETIGGALSVLVHTAYHLGEIRQATCILRQNE